MKCPRCSRPVDHEADTCYSCGYSNVESEDDFGDQLLVMQRISDGAHCLRKHQRDDLDHMLDRVQARFPQLLFFTYITTLEARADITEVGFWLINHARVKGAEFARPNENAILVIVDVEHKQIGFSLGYFAEYLLPEEEAFRVLEAARPYLVNGDYGRALTTLFEKLGRVLSKRSRQLKKLRRRGWEPEFSAQEVPNILDIPQHQTPEPQTYQPASLPADLPPILER